MIGQRKPRRNAPYKWFKLPRRQDSLSESACVSLYTYCTLFPPNKHFTCFTTFCLCGSSFLQSQRARALSLATGLVARIQCSHCLGLTPISGRELKPCFKPLQAEATWDQAQRPETCLSLGPQLQPHVPSSLPPCGLVACLQASASPWTSARAFPSGSASPPGSWLTHRYMYQLLAFAWSTPIRTHT